MSTFAKKLLDWHQQHGRHDLPWQKNKNLYRIWVAEIMLQQTQVVTVIPYYQKFIKRFSQLKQLAQATEEEVLSYWAGLGYYARARNLHKTAQLIVGQHQANFPENYFDVLALPGIGQSTAGAILAQGLGQHHAILDGNVKRVLSRYKTISGFPTQASVQKELWCWAKKYTPAENTARYTQAIMDLGAQVCTRTRPNCLLCPLKRQCKAHQLQQETLYPNKKPRKKLPTKQKRLLVIQNHEGAYLLEKRPPVGIWGGLWSLPELELGQVIVNEVEQQLQMRVHHFQDLAKLKHSFTHFHLEITPCLVLAQPLATVAEKLNYQWHTNIKHLALPTPIKEILKRSKINIKNKD